MLTFINYDNDYLSNNLINDSLIVINDNLILLK